MRLRRFDNAAALGQQLQNAGVRVVAVQYCFTGDCDTSAMVGVKATT